MLNYNRNPKGLNRNKHNFQEDLVIQTLEKFPRFKECSECGKMLVREFDDISAAYEHINVVYSPYSNAWIYDAPKAITDSVCQFDYEELEITTLEYEILQQHELEAPHERVQPLANDNRQALLREAAEVLQTLHDGEFVHWYDVAVQSQTIEHILFMYCHNDHYLTNPKIRQLIKSTIVAVTAADSNAYKCSHVNPVYVKGKTEDEVLVWANIQPSAPNLLPGQKVLEAKYFSPLLDHLDGSAGKHARLSRIATSLAGGR